MRFDGWDSLPPQSAPPSACRKIPVGLLGSCGLVTVAHHCSSLCLHAHQALPRVAALRSTAEVCTRTSLIAPMLEHQRSASQPLRTRTHFQSFCPPLCTRPPTWPPLWLLRPSSALGTHPDCCLTTHDKHMTQKRLRY